jgi:hypothetical protein
MWRYADSDIWIKMSGPRFGRRVWDVLHKLHDSDLEDIEKELNRLNKVLKKSKVSMPDWMPRFGIILLNILEQKRNER